MDRAGEFPSSTVPTVSSRRGLSSWPAGRSQRKSNQFPDALGLASPDATRGGTEPSSCRPLLYRVPMEVEWDI